MIGIYLFFTIIVTYMHIPGIRYLIRYSMSFMGNKKPTNKKNAVKDHGPGLFGRLLRGFVTLGILLIVILYFGSKFVRNELLDRIQKRSLASSSVVYSRTIEITQGTNLRSQRIIPRLERLGYQKVSSRPERAGQIQTGTDGIWLYLRDVHLSNGKVQPEGLFFLSTSGDEVNYILEPKYSEKVERISLEQETLSLFGDKSTRATSPKSLDEFPPYLANAVLAIEDERFYQHYGIDPIAIIRAATINLTSGSVRQGGSTLTQQLAKNVFFSQQRSLVRKVAEAFFAIMIEMSCSKREILEFYLNEVFLGQEGLVAIHGFGEASQSFFGKDVQSITPAEAATLAGIIKAPTSYSPRFHPENAQKRREVVLQKMVDLGYLTDNEFKQATRQTIRIVPAQRIHRQAPYFVDYIRKELTPILDEHAFEKKVIRIYSGIDPEYQRCAQAAVTNGMARLEKQYPRFKKRKKPLQAALISVSTADKQIRAWVGGRDYGLNQFCRVSMAKRQPGSAFKPFVYLTALDKNLNNYRVARVTNTLMDEPIKIQIPGVGTWEPKNYDENFRGEVTLREALTYSLNIPTVELAQKVGIDAVANTAELFGFGHNLPRVPSLALGAGEVTPLEMGRAYLALANGGILANVISTLSVTDDDITSPLYSPRIDEQRIASEPAVYVLTNLMQSVVEYGTGKVLREMGFKNPAAGKTGTSNDTRDAWFAGFTPSLLSVVWVGLDDNDQLGLTGGRAAAPIWAEYMKCVSSMEPELDFIPPQGVVFREVDSASHLLWNSGCDGHEVTEVFVEGTEPVTSCNEVEPVDSNSEEEGVTTTQPSEITRKVAPRVRVRDMGDTEKSPKRVKQKSFWDSIWSVE